MQAPRTLATSGRMPSAITLAINWFLLQTLSIDWQYPVMTVFPILCSGRFCPASHGIAIVANGYTGALHMWQRSQADDGNNIALSGWSSGHWAPRHVAGRFPRILYCRPAAARC